MLELLAKTLGRLVMSGLILAAWHAYNRYTGFFTGEPAAFSAVEYAAAVLLVWSACPCLARFAGPDAETRQQQATLPGTAREIACQEASARAIAQYGRSTGVTQDCPACGDRISVRAIDAGMWLSVVTDCTCRTCAGKFRLPAARGHRGMPGLGKRFDASGPQAAQLVPDASSAGQSRM